MKLNNTWHYLAMAALLGVGACSSSRQTAQNAGEVDDLYGNSGDAVVASANERQTSARQDLRTARLDRRQQRLSNINPDYNEEQQSGVVGTNQQEYYSELTVRNVQRGISADPGWGDVNSAYNSGYNNGYNNSLYGANSWNRWGTYGGGGFYSGLGLGLGLGYGGFGGYGYSPFGIRFGYNPFGFGGGYNSYAFGSPYGYGYDPFYSSYGYGGYGGYGFGGYGGGYGNSSFYGYRPSVVNNYYVTGADPYRNNRTSGARYSAASGRYNGDFNNTPRTSTDPGGRRSARTYTGNSGYTNTTPAPSRGGDSYYSRPADGGYNGSRSNTRGTYYYDNSGSTGGRTSGNSAPATQSYGGSSRGSTDTYYSAPSRGSSRGNYTPSYDASGSQNRSYSAPSNSAPSRSYSQPSQSYSQPSYSAPSRGSYSAPSAPSYSAPSHSSGGGGGGGSSSGGGGGGGGSRGPR